MKILFAPINPIVGDIEGNASIIEGVIQDAVASGDALVVTPELALCGYPPKDLLWQDQFVEQCMRAADRIGSSCPASLTIIIGTPWRSETGAVHNALVAYRGGERLRVYAKRLLPTYDVFDEDRYFTPGDRAGVIDVIVSGRTVRVGLAICEDLWRGEDAGFASRYRELPDPIVALAQESCDCVISPSASPFVSGKTDRHRNIIRSAAMRLRVPVYSVNQLGGNDELIFDGHVFGFDASGAEIVARPRFIDGTVRVSMGQRAVLAPHQSDEADLFDALTLGVRDYLRKTGFNSALIGLSGGIDSALTAVIACAAIGPSRVHGLAMPSKYSSDHSIQDALDLASNLGMRCDIVPIQDGFERLSIAADHYFESRGLARIGENLPDLTEENLQSRIRGTLLMAASNRTGSIVLTTGNKSEMAVGYCTLYGDMNGGLAVLSDVTKQWVYRLSRWINEHHGRCGFPSPPIPVRSIEKAPSAELRPNQTDQDSLPTYEVLDAIIAAAVEERKGAAAIVAMGFDEHTVRRILRLIDIAEYKRKQAALGLKVSTVAFGSGRRWPIASKRRF